MINRFYIKCMFITQTEIAKYLSLAGQEVFILATKFRQNDISVSVTAALCCFLYDIEGDNTRPLQWRHNGRDSVSNHQPHDCLLNGLFRRRSKKTSKLCITGLCTGNSPVTGVFPAQMASNAENISISWRHHAHGIPAVHERFVSCH